MSHLVASKVRYANHLASETVAPGAVSSSWGSGSMDEPTKVVTVLSGLSPSASLRRSSWYTVKSRAAYSAVPRGRVISGGVGAVVSQLN